MFGFQNFINMQMNVITEGLLSGDHASGVCVCIFTAHQGYRWDSVPE